MDSTHLQAWWAHRQSLSGEVSGLSPAVILSKIGWARSVGGANPYLTLFSRAGLSREEVDKAAEELEISELPSVRRCTYVLPRKDFALGLTLGAATGTGDMKTAYTLGVTDKEIEHLCERVLEVLKDGGKDPAAMKPDLGDAVRSLGEEGKKKGLTTTLPLALGRLQTEGEILRRPVSGRFDVQRYVYVLWKNSPLRSAKLNEDEAYAEIADRYFDWIAPASLARFCWFSGLGIKAAQAALEPLELAPIEPGSKLLIKPRLLDAFSEFKHPQEPQYSLVSSIDGLMLLRREVACLLKPEHLSIKVKTGKGIAEVGGVQDLSSNAILDRGRIIGLWEYDPYAKAIVWCCFEEPTAELRAEIRRTSEWATDQLGDVRSFSLDSPESRKPMIEALREGFSVGLPSGQD